ncbi:Hypothetical_protein [Hexamita inflata]|uniref:Hypothetical_protein n=1 Tax=Hexamita inflata TaxID=28002 RepID=A0AA86Q7U0_9EUKA|nr:Hypothetical protein HINF_LOCUS38438 [Hexamita inflata]
MVLLQILLVLSIVLFVIYKQIITLFMDINYEIDCYKQQLIQQYNHRAVNLHQNYKLICTDKILNRIEHLHSTEPNSESLIYSETSSEDVMQLFEQSLSQQFILPENQQISSMNYIIRQK